MSLLQCGTLGGSRFFLRIPVAATHEQLLARGVGHQVKLVRTDGSEVRGRIVAIWDDAVEVQSRAASRSGVGLTSVSFAEIGKVKGPGLSRGVKTGIGVGGGVVVTAAMFGLIVQHELSKPWKF